MMEARKSVEQLLGEVREELARLNSTGAPSLPRYAVDGALRIVEKSQTTERHKAKDLHAAA